MTFYNAVATLDTMTMITRAGVPLEQAEAFAVAIKNATGEADIATKRYVDRLES